MKKLTILLALIGCIDTLLSQENIVLERVVSNMTKQLSAFPQEKIHLSTDKSYYITGEKIFFRIFLLDASSNQQAVQSRYVYVELINPVDSVVKRVKIRPDSTNLFYGASPISENLPQGIYKIRSYTQYMRNQGESSFFSKYVRISDPQSSSVLFETDFQFASDGKINTSLRFIDAKTKNIIHPQLITLRLNQEPSFTGKPDEEGWIRVELNIRKNATTRVVYVELKENHNLFRQYIRIPYPEGDFDVSFYPEGGHLIAGQESKVAFKAVDNDGTSLEVKGKVVNSAGDTVTEFVTFHDGMGEFIINSLPGEYYQAICYNGDRTLRFDLPKPQTNTVALKTIIIDNKLLIKVNKYDPVPCPELYLLIHFGGLVTYAKAWDASKDFITFDASFFPSGISHVLLLTKDAQIISERLVFLLNNDWGKVLFETQKKAYGKREQVQSKIQLITGEQLPLKGNFSISVTDDRKIVVDTTSGILSGILLQSELRGNIENPEYYFQKGNRDAEYAADLLMRTHGWARYAIPNVVRGKLSYPTIPFEKSQKISGTVKSGLLSREATNFDVSLISLDAGFFDMTQTDKNGCYTFQQFEFPDSTEYVIQALNSKGKGGQTTELLIEDDTFPEIHATWIEPLVSEEKSLDYVAKADLQYTYENGIKIINLPEVRVKETYRDKKKFKSVFYREPDNSISEEKIEKYGFTNIINALNLVTGVSVAGNTVRIRDGKYPPLIVIDDVVMSNMSGEDLTPDQSFMENLNLINIHDIAQIDILKNANNLAIFGMHGASGAIVIHTKKGDNASSPNPLLSYNIKQWIPLGYQLPIEFYSPKYNTQESLKDSKPDLRTTIYWNPHILTDDDGIAKLGFYTADDPTTYSVIIEGISDDGRLIYYRGHELIIVK
ncbi:MAG: TonB-dependent receptor plug domain-containing protein [Tannerella sp.]|jgi:TonB-dependent SusC/RagA subfamily outer membrane receptor|nr:TonB-dependent receptor plug domain-containing protein [Tannerella sp.]